MVFIWLYCPCGLKLRKISLSSPEIALDIPVAVCYDLTMGLGKNSDSTPAEVYILHFKRTYWGHAQHYVGYTTIGALARINLHRRGRGSLLVNYATNTLGIDFAVGLIEPFATRLLARWREKQLKREKHLSRHCEICQKEKADGESRE